MESSAPAAAAAAPAALAIWDWLVLLAYLVVTIGIGTWAMRQITDAGAFLMARRKLGKVMTMAQSFAGGVNASDPIAVTGKVYRDGMSGMWTTLNFLLLTPWFWIRDPVGRRLRLVTGIDVVQLRYGRLLAWIQLFIGVILGPINIGLGILAAGKVTLGVAGGQLMPYGILGMSQATTDKVLATGLVAVPTIIYTVMGGIIGVCATDIFMSLLIVVLSFIVLPYLWHAVGGLEAIQTHMPNGHWDLISSSAGADFTLIGIFWFCVSWIVGLGPGPNGAKDEMTARIGGLGLIFKRVCTLGWAAIGIFGLVYFTQKQMVISDPDTVFALVNTELLPVGLRGVLVAAILAAAMSTIAGMGLGFSGQTLHNIYRPLVAPKASPSHYLTMARVLATLGLTMAWLVAVVQWVNNTDIFKYFAAIGIMGGAIGLPVFFCYLWRRATSAGAIAATLVALPASLVNLFASDLSKPIAWTDWRGIFNGLDLLRQLWVANLQAFEWIYCQMAQIITWKPLGFTEVVLKYSADGLVVSAPLPISVPATLVPVLLVFVVVSLFTKQHNARHVEEFYARLDTPVGDEHLLVAKGIKVDLLQDLGSDADIESGHKDPSKRLLFLDLLYLPKLLWTRQVSWRDYRIDLIGIAYTGAFVLCFILMITGGIAWLRPDRPVTATPTKTELVAPAATAAAMSAPSATAP